MVDSLVFFPTRNPDFGASKGTPPQMPLPPRNSRPYGILRYYGGKRGRTGGYPLNFPMDHNSEVLCCSITSEKHLAFFDRFLHGSYGTFPS